MKENPEMFEVLARWSKLYKEGHFPDGRSHFPDGYITPENPIQLPDGILEPKPLTKMTVELEKFRAMREALKDSK